ncbi:isochorismatase family protein [Marinilactibacillus sp. GCM10026970]|uniref:isochorismatase family protein n=1 Tax=Marinilactibacillus sp. GCM10026970 TaxID=3252642 RepID=UPI003615392F
MQALIVLDAQKGILKRKDFNKELVHIHTLIDDFKKRQQVVVATKHILEDSGSIFDPSSVDSELAESIEQMDIKIIEKDSPNALLNHSLQEYLKLNQVSHLFIVGFNAEYCCLFTSIAGIDRGYKVTYIEDASGSVNNEDTYEMKGLDIVDFVGSVLDWSGVVEVLYMEEYKEQYCL